MNLEMQTALVTEKPVLRNPLQLCLHISEFFILRKYRQHGVGRQVAFWVFDHFPGEWKIPKMGKLMGVRPSIYPFSGKLPQSSLIYR